MACASSTALKDGSDQGVQSPKSCEIYPTPALTSGNSLLQLGLIPSPKLTAGVHRDIHQDRILGEAGCKWQEASSRD